MKKFIVRVLIFFAVVALIDVAFGYACCYLNSHAKGGDTQNHYYIAKECDKDILIFGSSRCMHHYVPKIIEDTLGMSCYNCGVNGNGIVYLYSRLLWMTERYTPKVLVYDIQSGFDVAEGDNTKYLGWQKRFYDEPGVSDVFSMVNKFEIIKMYSQLYRYNESFVQMIMDNIHPVQDVEYGGYRPHHSVMTYKPQIVEPNQITTWDPVKKECMLRLIGLCKDKGIRLVFAYSPSYGGVHPPCDDIVKKLAEDNNIILIDHYRDPNFCMTNDYFYDSVHMNDSGATAYSQTFASELKDLLRL